MNSSIGDCLKKIKIGVIGAGRWGKKHVDEYAKMNNVDLSWVSDLRQENLQLCKEKYNVTHLTEDYHELLSSDVDAVSVCTVNEQHFDVCRDALQAGKHVLVEKPLTLSSKTSKELVKIAKNNKRLLAVGHIFRFNNALIETKKRIQNNFFGDIYYLRLQWTALIYPDKPLDIIVDMMPHTFDIMNFLLDSWPTKITCFSKGFRNKKLDDTAYILCEFPHNVMTHTEISWTLPEKIRQVDLIGSKRCAKIQCLDQKVRIFENDESEQSLQIQPNNTLKDELSHFVNAIEQGSFVSNDGELGAKVVELIEHTQTSLKKAKTILL